jgi:hypothetical protein
MSDFMGAPELLHTPLGLGDSRHHSGCMNLVAPPAQRLQVLKVAKIAALCQRGDVIGLPQIALFAEIAGNTNRVAEVDVARIVFGKRRRHQTLIAP